MYQVPQGPAGRGQTMLSVFFPAGTVFHRPIRGRPVLRVEIKLTLKLRPVFSV